MVDCQFFPSKAEALVKEKILAFLSILREIRKAVAVCCLAFFCLSSPSYATDPLDISTGLKTLLLMNEKSSGTVPVAIVYDAGSPESKADAESMKTDIDNGVGVLSGLTLNAYVVSTADIAKISGAKIAFLAKDINSSHFGSIYDIASRNEVLTISTDINCVKANKCILSIVSKPHVEIYYSPAAAEASHISFAPAFTMLVKQL